MNQAVIFISALLSLFGLAVHADPPAVETFSDSVKGNYFYVDAEGVDAARTKAFESYNQSCKEWKDRITKQLARVSFNTKAECLSEGQTANLEALGSGKYRGFQVTSVGSVTVAFKDEHLRLKDTVFGAFVPDRQNAKLYAIAEYDKTCAAWKTAIQKKFGADLLFMTCGAERILEGTPAWGAIASSQGIFFVRSSGTVLTMQSYFKGEKHDVREMLNRETHDYEYNAESCREARMAASAEFAPTCSSWKRALEVKYGSRLIFSTCVPERPEHLLGNSGLFFVQVAFETTPYYTLRHYAGGMGRFWLYE